MKIDRPLPFALPFAMSPAERVAGRYMRGPDHPASGGSDDDDSDDLDLDGGDDDDQDDDQSGHDTDDGESDQEDDEDDSEPSDDDDDGGKRKPSRNGYEKRIAKLTRRAKDAEAELARVRGTKREEPKTPPKTPEGKPKLADFDNYEDWIEALTDYKADERVKKSKAEESRDREESEFLKRFNAGRKAFKDWDNVVDDDVEITNHMQSAIKSSDFPADIVYYLGKHPQEAEKIADLPAAKQALAIGKIEARIEARKAGDKGKTTSSAPDPITPTKTKGKAITRDYDKMSYADFAAQRRREETGK